MTALCAGTASDVHLPTAGADNSSLPGMGGVFNTTNCHLYHYAGNNPIRYVDPEGLSTYIDENTGIILYGLNDDDYNVYATPFINGQRCEGPCNRIGETIEPDTFSDLKYRGSNINNFWMGEGLYGFFSYSSQDIPLFIRWAMKDIGEELTPEEARLQRNIGLAEMIVGPIAGTGLSYFGPEAFTLGMYVMADGAILFSDARSKKKYSPFATMDAFIFPFAISEDGKYIFYLGY